MTTRSMTTGDDHPFAAYIRILGRGRNGSRALSRDEARAAMEYILDGTAQPVQIGAFLMLMRVKEEAPEELAGLVEAVRAQWAQASPGAMIDWPAYAGKRRELPWFVLSAFLVATSGLPVLFHGPREIAGRLTVTDALAAFDLHPVTTLAAARAAMTERGVAFVPLDVMAPRLAELWALRPLLGLRSPVHTIARLLNPLNAPYSVQGVFHPGYRLLQIEAARLLGQPHAAVLKGEGGEFECRPEIESTVSVLHDGQLEEWQWLPATSREPADSDHDLQRLVRLWRGEATETSGETRVLETAAMILHLRDQTTDMARAREQARALWEVRPKGFPGCR